jgi:hypothetical protein
MCYSQNGNAIQITADNTLEDDFSFLPDSTNTNPPPVESNQAFGDNLKKLGDGNFAIISGDVNQDGIINQDDFTELEIGTQIFLTGYVTGDLNGDGVTENSDYSLIENNLGKVTIHP